MLRTLKVISYRATHFLSFLIIIMVINVYKLKSLTPDKRSAEMETGEQSLVPFCLLPRVMALQRSLLVPVQLSSSLTLVLSTPSQLLQAPLGAKCQELVGGGIRRAQGKVGISDLQMHRVGTKQVLSKCFLVKWEERKEEGRQTRSKIKRQ